MRLILAAALCLVACGGSDESASLSGNWEATMSGRCSGTMTLSQSGTSLSGTLACGSSAASLHGATSGGSQLSLTMSVPGYQDALITGSYTSTAITAAINGSGFTGQSFVATKR